MFGKNKKGNVSDSAYGVMLGEKLSFAAAEAYKLLRANLMFALPMGRRIAVWWALPVPSAARGSPPPP